MAELVRQAEEAGAISALALQFQQLMPGIAPAAEGEAIPEDGTTAEDPVGEATADSHVASV